MCGIFCSRDDNLERMGLCRRQIPKIPFLSLANESFEIRTRIPACRCHRWLRLLRLVSGKVQPKELYAELRRTLSDCRRDRAAHEHAFPTLQECGGHHARGLQKGFEKTNRFLELYGGSERSAPSCHQQHDGFLRRGKNQKSLPQNPSPRLQ